MWWLHHQCQHSLSLSRRRFTLSSITESCSMHSMLVQRGQQPGCCQRVARDAAHTSAAARRQAELDDLIKRRACCTRQHSLPASRPAQHRGCSAACRPSRLGPPAVHAASSAIARAPGVEQLFHLQPRTRNHRPTGTHPSICSVIPPRCAAQQVCCPPSEAVLPFGPRIQQTRRSSSSTLAAHTPPHLAGALLRDAGLVVITGGKVNLTQGQGQGQGRPVSSGWHGAAEQLLCSTRGHRLWTLQSMHAMQRAAVLPQL